ncbi:hypothetical protein MKX01_020287 [Papaver californicum]|nr:hypothetical protein MKX01_020287 [Papaver californicum]
MDAAQSYNETDFRKHMDRLREQSSKAAKEVEDLGYASWARVKARRGRFNVMNTNNSESFTMVLSKVKSYPVVHIMEFVISTLNEWFKIRKSEAGAWTGVLSPFATYLIKSKTELVKPFQVSELSGTRFQVIESPSFEAHVVNLEERSCSCGAFDKEFLPCIHVLALINKNDKLSVFDYCGDYWRTSVWRSAYQGTLESPMSSVWEVPDIVKNRVCKPPANYNRRGPIRNCLVYPK